MAQARAGKPETIVCPCSDCQNVCRQHYDIVFEHLVRVGMDSTYNTWVLHGECPSASTQHEDVEMPDTYRMCRDAFMPIDNVTQPMHERREQEFTSLLEDGETPLYPGCTKYTKLLATVVLYKHKATNGLSDKSFSELLEIPRDMLPQDNTLPDSMYSTKRLLKAFDLGYEKIHACVNDCCLFRKEKELMETCSKCNSSQWKSNPRTNKIQKGVPAKVLRYFPIIPRLRRMFMLAEKAEQLTWHSNHKSQDGKMRHPVDSLAWDTVNQKWPCFASDSRNLRLGLAADGFNPFADLSSRYSCWPVILVTYNLPLWLCMAKENLMLTLLIPGPKQPGNDIDVYLEPLVDDLKELWNNGVEVYDAFTKSMFNLKAILMWTINDFPAYRNLAGCPTKGKLACPICSLNTCLEWLKWSHKFTYMCHRQFLAPTHPFQKKKSWFDGNHENRGKPRPLTGSEVLRAVKDIENNWGKKIKPIVNVLGKKIKKRKKRKTGKALLLRHNLDVMHIEKNVCENIIGTLLHLKKKSKDGLNSRRDLEKMSIRHELHAKDVGNKKYILPTAPHTFSKKEKQIFCARLKSLKLPDGYSSNLANCISLEEYKILGLKSHDCHILMQQLLPVSLRGLLPNGPRIAIFRLCAFFNELCQRVIDRDRLEPLEDEVTETLCMFERFFPLSFFDIMIHLSIHLGRETRICGPVQYRWMYPFERFMKVLKGYVRNRARPEGCIAECYLAEECMRFCSGYMKKAAEIGIRHNRNEDFKHETILEGHPISKGRPLIMADDLLRSAHLYVLRNSAEVEPFIEMHVEELKCSNRRLAKDETLTQKRHIETFYEWLARKVQMSATNVLDTLPWLARGPRQHAMSYSGYIINKHRFHALDVERSTQNSGVSIDAETICRSSARDNTQVFEKISYYGRIKDIILLDYNKFQVPIFKCEWANIGNGVKVEDGFTLVNLHQGQNQFERDPFILASQAKQVFYSRDNDTSSWYVVLKAPPRGFYELEMYDETTYRPSTPLDVSNLDLDTTDIEEDYVRRDCESIEVFDEE
ncbi:hypothetical protein L1049_015098 [Liquidambar formosana]|uniref:Transposase n=1 Tax=Liquidambar formosana TaxID=63359 RepID=A0AAP0RWZ0_LIQFO